MEELYEIIRNALRKGDAFTQYSSSQYLFDGFGNFFRECQEDRRTHKKQV